MFLHIMTGLIRIFIDADEDDHNDRFVTDDSFSELDGLQEDIRMDLFEE